MYSMGTNRMRMRMFHTQQDVHPNHIFCPVVTAPSNSADYKPRVDWSNFHEVVALEEDELKSPHLERVSKAWGALSSKPLSLIFGNACLCAARLLTVLACCSKLLAEMLMQSKQGGCTAAYTHCFASAFLPAAYCIRPGIVIVELEC